MALFDTPLGSIDNKLRSDPSACQSNERLEASLGLLLPGGEAAKLLEFAEATFDTVWQLIVGLVVAPLVFAIGPCWYDCFGLHRCFDMSNDGTGDVAFVGQDRFSPARAQQLNRWRVVTDMAAGEKKIHRHAQLVHQQVHFGCQSSSATPQSLVRAPVFGPVTAC